MRKSKTLFSKAERLWKECVLLRDGRECQVKLFYPHLQLGHTNVFQGDHCITRRCSWTFFMVENGTVVCSACNMLKSMNVKSVSRAIDDIVKFREGVDVFNHMVGLDRSKRNNRDFRKVWYLEERIKGLTAYKAQLQIKMGE